ncbi:hypothetical protein SAMN05216241_103236 [Limimonas halophila]|uniref:FlgN protein n=1 Tax=Limimonas halophila TaxID=1082479 RepID=A0A1G7Q595_9PROT|nr:hypothetical protein [Limimonas halophila]SDF93664.1 hypothetical protein SAMN05216241_103236 [Limimonas halophila]
MTEAVEAGTQDGTVADLLATTERLTELLNEESDRARSGDRHGVEALSTEKARLTDKHQELVEALSARPELLDELDNETHQALSDGAQRFQEALSANQRALRAGMAVADTILQAGVKAVKEAERSQAGYSALGTTRRPPRAGASTSLALNQRL